jgi:spore coat polysaccharide biosynthesis protein SpsF (cytidylyltransferase family)
MGSTRLPGKVLLDLAGMPTLAWVTRAAQATRTVDQTWIATSNKASDDPVADWARRHGIASYRGSEHDVLDRYACVARASSAQIVVRLTADCPFLDSQVIDATVQLRARSGVTYTSNVDPRSWPRGLDCEVVTAEALFSAAAEAADAFDREHVTPFVRNHPERFPTKNLFAPLPGLAEERWTLDTSADYAFLSAVAERLPSGRPPSYCEVLAILDREPNLREINRGAALHPDV